MKHCNDQWGNSQFDADLKQGKSNLTYQYSLYFDLDLNCRCSHWRKDHNYQNHSRSLNCYTCVVRRADHLTIHQDGLERLFDEQTDNGLSVFFVAELKTNIFRSVGHFPPDYSCCEAVDAV